MPPGCASLDGLAVHRLSSVNLKRQIGFTRPQADPTSTATHGPA
jgi:hypothetical protein